jgi:hypothetical protein
VRERKSDGESWTAAAPFGPWMLNKSARQLQGEDLLHDVLHVEGVRSSSRRDNACNSSNDFLLRHFCTPRSSVSFTPRHLTLAAAVGAGGFGGVTLHMQGWGEEEELRTLALGSSTEDTDDDQEEEGNHVRLISHHLLQPASPSRRLLKLEAPSTMRHVRAADRNPRQVDSDVHQVARLQHVRDVPEVPPLHLEVDFPLYTLLYNDPLYTRSSEL